MKKVFILFLCLVPLLIVCSCNSSNEVLINKIYENENLNLEQSKFDASIIANKSTCYIYNKVKNEEIVYTGTVVYNKNNTHYIVTTTSIGNYGEEVDVNDQVTNYKGTIIGYDEKNGLALIKVNNSDFSLHPISYSNNEYVKGQRVIVSSTSSDKTTSITSGVLSRFDNYKLQTDAAMNSLTFGGGVYDLDGKLLGISISKIYSDVDQDKFIAKMGYALNSSIVKTSVEQMLKYGKLDRKLLGIVAMQHHTSILEGLDYKVPDTDDYIIIANVDESGNSALYLKNGDILMSINGISISHMDDVTAIIRQTLPNEILDVAIKRYNKSNKTFKDFNYKIVLK